MQKNIHRFPNYKNQFSINLQNIVTFFQLVGVTLIKNYCIQNISMPGQKHGNYRMFLLSKCFKDFRRDLNLCR